MAPELLPFIACGALILAGAVGCVVTLASFALLCVVEPRSRRSISALPLMAAGVTVVCLAVAGAVGLYIRQAFFLNEPMAVAACHGNLPEVRRLLAAGASPDSCDVDCAHPALVCAAEAGEADVVRLLLDRGATLDSRDTAGRSALEVARRGGHEDVVAVLQRAGEQH